MSASSATRACLNPECRSVLPERHRKGWRCANGNFAELCDRCGSSFEEGRFCDTFHARASGWRCCEFCGVRVHCGCIVSAHAFHLLDTGGIECLACARKNAILLPPAWPASQFPASTVPDGVRHIDSSARNWEQIGGTGCTVPWNQGTSVFSSTSPSGVCPRIPFVHDVSNGINRLAASQNERNRAQNSLGRFVNIRLEPGSSETTERGDPGKQSSSLGNHLQQSLPCLDLDMNSTLAGETDCQARVPDIYAPPVLGMHPNGNTINGTDPTSKAQSVKLQSNAEGQDQTFSRYLTKITDQELQQIAVDSHSVITPLFEKMLSASDAGKIGRIVLPKKCAETYFPPINQPEGIPLEVHDAKGKEWVFHFRFWPNNNSRMYVLEGIHPCIQSMHLQAGDVVTFSRLEPEGKLIMGFRKASTVQQSDQDALHLDVLARDLNSHHSEMDKSGYIARRALGEKRNSQSKRKSCPLKTKNKPLKLDSVDVIELKVTFEEAQELMRPPDCVRSVTIIGDMKIEEYEDAPVIGRPAIIAKDSAGEEVQWARCGDCFKWRRIPADVILPYQWTCPKNQWDPERSSCATAQEIETAELEELLLASYPVLKKAKAGKKKNTEAVEALHDLATLSIQGSSREDTVQPTTSKHPRHKPGCSCIVCIQPPSGQSPKHAEACLCNICSTIRRRAKTQMLRREKRMSEKEGEPMQEKLQPTDVLEAGSDALGNSSAECINHHPTAVHDDASDAEQRKKTSSPPFRGQIDLNAQPEREEDLPSGNNQERPCEGGVNVEWNFLQSGGTSLQQTRKR